MLRAAGLLAAAPSVHQGSGALIPQFSLSAVYRSGKPGANSSSRIGPDQQRKTSVQIFGLQPALRKGREHAGGYLGVHRGRGGACRACCCAQALAQRGFDALEKLVHALLQAFVLQHQRIAHHHAHQARIALTKLKQQRHHARRLVGAALGAWTFYAWR